MGKLFPQMFEGSTRGNTKLPKSSTPSAASSAARQLRNNCYELKCSANLEDGDSMPLVHVGSVPQGEDRSVTSGMGETHNDTTESFGLK